MSISKRLNDLEKRDSKQTIIMQSCLDDTTPAERRREIEQAGPNATILRSSLLEGKDHEGHREAPE